MNNPRHRVWRHVWRMLSFPSRWNILVVFAGLLAGNAMAGPPFLTDDPEPVGYREWEVNYGFTYLRSAGMNAGALTSFDINYGVYPGIQLHIQPQIGYSSGGGTRGVGVGDTEAGIKYRLTAATEDKSKWMVALYPMLEIPTGSPRRNLGAGAHSVFLPIWAQTTRGRWTVFGGGGVRLVNTPDARNSRAGGVTLLFEVSDRLQFGGELFAETRTTVGGSATASVNLGGVYMLQKGLSLLFSAGHGVRDAARSNRGAFYVGLRTAY